ncbi:MAG: hypothetical protein JSR00_02535 [Bacteroidetes bacterium]|nr:hypothetical protein [Bacteroidota bacterium]
MASILNKLFFNKNKLTREEKLEELQAYLIQSENLFFESSFVHTLKPEHRKSLLVAMRLFYPGSDYNETSNRHYVYNFISNWYKYTNDEMQEHCDKYPADSLFALLSDLPMQSKIGILLLMNCILYIDKNATAQQINLAKAIYTVIGITPKLYNSVMTRFGDIRKDKWFSYIHNHAF